MTASMLCHLDDMAERIQRYFWTRNLSHWERVLTATFIWINGLNPDVYYDWCELKAFFSRGSAIHRHSEQLLRYFREGRRYSLWSWHVLNWRYEWLDGTVRVPPPTQRSHSSSRQQ